MRLTINVTGKHFLVTLAPKPKVDQGGIQRIDKGTRLPMWTTEVMARDEDGGEIINVTTVGKAPDVESGEDVELKSLIAIPWYTNGRGGIAFRADAIVPVED